MAEKIIVDLTTKRLIAKAGVTSLDAKIDLYSDLKEDWQSNNGGELGFEFPVRTIGGDPLGGGLDAGAFFFLRNDLGWRIRPDEADHELTIDGNLFAEDAAFPIFVPPLGTFTVLAKIRASSLTQVLTSVTANITQIDGSEVAAKNLSASAETMIKAVVNTTAFAPTTTQFETSDITEATANHFKPRVIGFRTGVLAKQFAEITASSLVNGRTRFTVTQMTDAPANGDAFIVI